MSSAPEVDQVSFLDQYTAPADVYDEMVDRAGNVRPHYQHFCRRLTVMGQPELARRWKQSQELLHENGIAFSAYGQTDSPTRPWELDPLPILIPGDSWKPLTRGIAQRARLLDLILADLYGSQRLLAQKLIPPEVVFRHPGFSPAYHGPVPNGQRLLTSYSTDLARSPEGAWWVLADRTEAASGVGFALENRIVISRMVPDIFHASQVERLAPYFIALRNTLEQSAPQHTIHPRIVLLSQGPESPNYFEDAYIARYLGYTLVEGGDLAVRSGQVVLKTLGGLIPVDVILRRPNSEFCDPLELAADSPGGVAGLLQAQREQAVAVNNVLGSGLVESPVFMAYLRGCCQELLDEDLLLPNVATWWCGEPESLKYVLNNLDGLTVRRAFRKRGKELPFNRRLQNWSRDRLSEAIRAEPHAFVGQEQVVRSTAPVWSNGRPKPARIALRCYAVASSDDYQVMSGGLVRVSESAQPLDMSILAGEGSKDAWILSDEPVDPISLLQPSTEVVQLRRSGAELPSRVADNLYWVGRHIERAEAAARLLRTSILRLTSETEIQYLSEMPLLLRALAEQGQIEPGYVVEGIGASLPDLRQALPDSVLDESQPGSLRSIVTQLFRGASLVRDRISSDSWRIVRRIDSQFRPWPQYAGVDLTDLLTLLDQMIIDLSSFSGMVMESMTRTHTWRFLDLGRRLERALQVISLARSALDYTDQFPAPVLEAMLEANDSLMTYRARYLSNLQLGAVIDLLLTDEINPRSLAFQLASLAEHVDQLPRDGAQPLLSVEQRLALALLHEIRMVDVSTLAELHTSGRSEKLQQLLAHQEKTLPLLSDAINHRYLIHATPSHQLTSVSEDTNAST